MYENYDAEWQYQDNVDWVDPYVGHRTKAAYSYSYDEFFHWKTDKLKSSNGAWYSDRMYQADREAWDKAHEAVEGRFEQMTKEEINKWLSIYMDCPCEVTALAEGCNQATGYPYYIIWYICS